MQLYLGYGPRAHAHNANLGTICRTSATVEHDVTSVNWSPWPLFHIGGSGGPWRDVVPLHSTCFATSVPQDPDGW